MKNRTTVTIPSLDQELQLIYPGEEGKVYREHMIATIMKVIQRTKVFTEGVQKECLDRPAPQVLALIQHHFSMTESMLGASLRTEEVLELDAPDTGYQKYLHEYLGHLERVVENLAQREKDPRCEPVGFAFVKQLAVYLLTHTGDVEDDHLRKRCLELLCKLAKIGLNTYKGVIDACESLSKGDHLSSDLLAELVRKVHNSTQTEEWHKDHYEKWKRVLFWGLLHSLQKKAGFEKIQELMFYVLMCCNELSGFGARKLQDTLNELVDFDKGVQALIGELAEGVNVTDRNSVQVSTNMGPSSVSIAFVRTVSLADKQKQATAIANFKERFFSCKVEVHNTFQAV